MFLDLQTGLSRSDLHPPLPPRLSQGYSLDSDRDRLAASRPTIPRNHATGRWRPPTDACHASKTSNLTPRRLPQPTVCRVACSAIASLVKLNQGHGLFVDCDNRGEEVRTQGKNLSTCGGPPSNAPRPGSSRRDSLPVGPRCGGDQPWPTCRTE